jgi:hypothetical protein
LMKSATKKATVRAFQLVAWQEPAEFREVLVPEPWPGQIK